MAVFLFHSLDADVRDINVRYAGVAFLKHFLAEAGVAGANVEDPTGFVDMGGDDVFEAAETLVPVERLGVSA